MPRTQLRSDSLPSEFFAPGFRAPTDDLPVKVQQQFHELRTATPSLLRVIAIGGGLSWTLLLTQTFNLQSTPVVLLPWGVLFIAAVVLLVAGLGKVEKLYQPAMAAGALVYFLLLSIHSMYLLISGASPLDALKLGDYSAIPAALFVASWPGLASIVVALLAVSVAAAFNLGTPPGFRMLIEILHALAPVVPFVIMAARGLSTTRTIDRAASRTYRDALVLARQKALGELETRFLAFIHDHVLTQLSAIWRGTIPPDPQRILADIRRSGQDSLDSLGGVTYGDAVNQISAAVLTEYPATRVDPPGTIPAGARLPATTVAALADALRQGAANVAKHAPGTTARLCFDLQPERFTAVLADDGPGFDPEGLPEDRVGIRVSILGRLDQTPGASGSVQSAPGEGCVITVLWDQHGQGIQVDPDVDTLPSVYESMGFSDIFQPGPAVVVWLMFLGLSLSNEHPRPLWWMVSMIFAAVTLGLLVQKPHERLSNRFTLASCVFIWLFYGFAIAENSADEQTWPFFWAPWVALLLCAYLAMRNRPLAGWGAWIGCMMIAQLFVWSGIQTDYIAPSNSWTHSLVLLPASILPWMVKRISDGLPLLISERRATAATAAVGLARQRFLDAARDWLSTRITMLFHTSLTPEQSSMAAHLLEQRLRDSIRSPLLDRPAITAGTWDARLRGVNVKLLDDYSLSPTTYRGRDIHPHITEVEDILTSVFDRAVEGDTVVVRLLPVGRDTAATVLHRRETTGESWRVRIHTGATST